MVCTWFLLYNLPYSNLTISGTYSTHRTPTVPAQHRLDEGDECLALLGHHHRRQLAHDLSEKIENRDLSINVSVKISF